MRRSPAAVLLSPARARLCSTKVLPRKETLAPSLSRTASRAMPLRGRARTAGFAERRGGRAVASRLWSLHHDRSHRRLATRLASRAAALLAADVGAPRRALRATSAARDERRAEPRTRFVGRFFFVTTPRRAGTLLPECGSPIG